VTKHFGHIGHKRGHSIRGAESNVKCTFGHLRESEANISVKIGEWGLFYKTLLQLGSKVPFSC